MLNQYELHLSRSQYSERFDFAAHLARDLGENSLRSPRASCAAESKRLGLVQNRTGCGRIKGIGPHCWYGHRVRGAAESKTFALSSVRGAAESKGLTKSAGTNSTGGGGKDLLGGLEEGDGRDVRAC
eukprot:258389-Rhodomonas_salina.1